MNITITAIIVATISACGYESAGNELEGQVKKVVRRTPIACGDYTEADVSLGVMRNGVGSMSKEDVALYVTDPRAIELLQGAARSGAIVQIGYDVRRATWCVPDHWLTSVRLADAQPEASAAQGR